MPVPAPDAALWGTVAAWWRRFGELARETRVTVGGMPGRIEAAPLSIGGEGPHMVAIDLVGTDFYWWQVEYPDECRAFLAKITEGMIRAEKTCRTVDPRPRTAYGLAEDSAQAMSAQMFRDFCVPFDERLYAEFGAGLPDGRGMHMCGRSDHLHAVLADELRISSFNVFGHLVDPRVAARNLGGRCRLWGNIDPMLLLGGTPDTIKAARRCLEEMAPFGGFTLGDGANICPGTPLENLNAVTVAAVEYGAPPRAHGGTRKGLT
jgi:uroporphyrinogen-III decarboxylase